MIKFQVGDTVSGGYNGITYTGVVTEIRSDVVMVDRAGWGDWGCKILYDGSVGGANGCYDGKTKLELVQKADTAIVTRGWRPDGLVFEEAINYNFNKTTIMDKITTFAKNLTLSAEEKALRKVGLKTECGDYTKSAESIIMQLICKEREATLVEIANIMIEEDKESK